MLIYAVTQKSAALSNVGVCLTVVQLIIPENSPTVDKYSTHKENKNG
jgi:hypothetical protein